MKYVPSLTSPVTSPTTGMEVRALAGIKRSKPVQARTLPPLVVQPHVRHEASSGVSEKEERRYDPLAHGERRSYCRRIEHRPVLIELRSSIERRRHNQRAGDITEHIDVKA